MGGGEAGGILLPPHLGTNGKKEARHAHAATEPDCCDVAANVPHGIVKSQRRNDLQPENPGVSQVRSQGRTSQTSGRTSHPFKGCTRARENRIRPRPHGRGHDGRGSAEGCADLSTSAVDVELHVFLVLRVEVQHGAHKLVAQLLIDGLAKEDDPLAVLRKEGRGVQSLRMEGGGGEASCRGQGAQAPTQPHSTGTSPDVELAGEFCIGEGARRIQALTRQFQISTHCQEPSLALR